MNKNYTWRHYINPTVMLIASLASVGMSLVSRLPCTVPQLFDMKVTHTQSIHMSSAPLAGHTRSATPYLTYNMWLSNVSRICFNIWLMSHFRISILWIFVFFFEYLGLYSRGGEITSQILCLLPELFLNVSIKYEFSTLPILGHNLISSQMHLNLAQCLSFSRSLSRSP